MKVLSSPFIEGIGLSVLFFFLSSLENFFFPLLLEREKGREREVSDAFLSVYVHTRNRICNVGTFPDRELNPQPFGYGTTLQPTEPHWPGQAVILSVVKAGKMRRCLSPRGGVGGAHLALKCHWLSLRNSQSTGVCAEPSISKAFQWPTWKRSLFQSQITSTSDKTSY